MPFPSCIVNQDDLIGLVLEEEQGTRQHEPSRTSHAPTWGVMHDLMKREDSQGCPDVQSLVHGQFRHDIT